MAVRRISRRRRGYRGSACWSSISATVLELVRRLRLTVWGARFFAHFGAGADNEAIATQLAGALAAFMREDPRLHPYDSKFDQVAAGREHFTAAELRGREVFRDAQRGNCASCHPDASPDGAAAVHGFPLRRARPAAQCADPGE